jgi:L-ascorbate metabolism protein UlaG (beta-lactamase superfamily)
VALGIYLVTRPPPRVRSARSNVMTLSITLIGGPTALIEIDGFRLLTDPTFDAPGAYQLPHVKLEKLTGPALATSASARSTRCCSATTSIRTISIIPAAISSPRPGAC